MMGCKNSLQGKQYPLDNMNNQFFLERLLMCWQLPEVYSIHVPEKMPI